MGVIRPHGRFSVPELWRNNEKALHDWLLMEGAVIAWRDDPSNQSFRFTISSCRPLGWPPMTRQVDDSEKLLTSLA